MERMRLKVNGESVEAVVEPQELLLDFLRDRLGLKGPKRSCEVQVCGTCAVLVDGLPVSACCMLACEAEGREVLTIEGFARQEEFGEFQEAFTRHAALQCGFCTAGFLMSMEPFLRDRAGGFHITETEVREALAGNLCRCTGYEAIVQAVLRVAR